MRVCETYTFRFLSIQDLKKVLFGESSVYKLSFPNIKTTARAEVWVEDSLFVSSAALRLVWIRSLLHSKGFRHRLKSWT